MDNPTRCVARALHTARLECTPLTDYISDFIILEKAGAVMPQSAAEIKTTAS